MIQIEHTLYSGSSKETNFRVTQKKILKNHEKRMISRIL